MTNNDQTTSFPSSGQFVLSYELIALLQWLMDNDIDKLKNIIKSALNNGLEEKLQNIKSKEEQSLDDIQENIIDFFSIIEALLIENKNELTFKKALEKKLIPAIDHIDSQECSDSIVKSSVEKATLNSEATSSEAARKILFKELLKHWQPNNKKIVN